MKVASAVVILVVLAVAGATATSKLRARTHAREALHVTGDEGCTNRGGKCQTTPCAGGAFVSNLCTGASDRRCCVPAGAHAPTAPAKPKITGPSAGTCSIVKETGDKQKGTYKKTVLRTGGCGPCSVTDDATKAVSWGLCMAATPCQQSGGTASGKAGTCVTGGNGGVRTCCVPAAGKPYPGLLSWDVDEATSVDQAKCMWDSGFRVPIVRCLTTSSYPDSNCVSKIKNLQTAGFTDIEIYMFPNRVRSAKTQVDATFDVLTKGGVLSAVKRVWLDIERESSGWAALDTSAGYATNFKFFTELVDAVKAHGYNPAIYTSVGAWTEVMGPHNKPADVVPLWYTGYDNNPEELWTAKSAFAVWTEHAEHQKQFQNDARICGMGGIDLTYRHTDFTSSPLWTAPAAAAATPAAPAHH